MSSPANRPALSYRNPWEVHPEEINKCIVNVDSEWDPKTASHSSELQLAKWRGLTTQARSLWQSGKDDKPSRHVLSVLKMNGAAPPSLYDLLPKGSSPLPKGKVQDLLKLTRLADARVIVCGESLAYKKHVKDNGKAEDKAHDEVNEKVIASFEKMAKSWDKDMFRALDFPRLLKQQDRLKGLYFEGLLKWDTKLNDHLSLRLLIGLLNGTESASEPMVVAGGVSMVRFPALAEGDKSFEMTFLHIDWLARLSKKNQPKITLGKGNAILLKHVGLRARLDAGRQAVQGLHGMAQWKTKDYAIDVGLEIDLDGKEVRFLARPNHDMTLDKLGKLAGSEATNAAAAAATQADMKGKIEGVLGPPENKVKLTLVEVRGGFAWTKDENFRITTLSLTVSAESTDGRGVPFAGGRLKPRLTILCDFSGKKTTLNVVAEGELTWEKLKLSAMVNTAAKTFEAALEWKDAKNDLIAQQFLALPHTSAPGKRGEEKKKEEEQEGLKLKLSGKYGNESEYNFTASNKKGYKIPLLKKGAGVKKEISLTLSDLSFEGSYKPGTKEEEPKWDCKVGGKAGFTDKGTFTVSGSYKTGPKEKTLKMGFKVEKSAPGDDADKLDFEQVFGGGGMADTPVPGAGGFEPVVAPKNQEKEKKPLSSLELKWERETKLDDESKKWEIKKDEVVITAKPEKINVLQALQGVLGWKPAGVDGLKEVTLKLETIKLTASKKELTLVLETPKKKKPADADTKVGGTADADALKKAEEEGLNITLGKAQFSLHDFKLVVSHKEEKPEDPLPGQKNPAAPAQPQQAGASGVVTKSTPKKRKLTATVSAKMKFHTWATANVEYTLGGAWKVGTVLKKPLKLHQLAAQFPVIKTEPTSVAPATENNPTSVATVTKKEPTWNLVLDQVAFYLTKNGNSYGASIEAYVQGLGQLGFQVMYTPKGWGLGMEMEVTKKDLEAAKVKGQNALAALKARGRRALAAAKAKGPKSLEVWETKFQNTQIAREKRMAEALKESENLTESVLKLLTTFSLEEIQLGFCTIDSSKKGGLKGTEVTQGKAGFGLSAKWKFAPEKGDAASQLAGVKKVMSYLGQAAESLQLNVFLSREEQEISVILKERQVPPSKAATEPSGKDKSVAQGNTQLATPYAGQEVRIGGTLLLKHSSGKFEIGMSAHATNVMISGKACSFNLGLAVTVGTGGASLMFKGDIVANNGPVPLYKGSKATLANVGLMIGVGSSGVMFGAWGKVNIGSFQAEALIYFGGAKQTAVALAISDVNLAQVAGLLSERFKDSKILQSVQFLGTPMKLNIEGKPPKKGESTIFISSYHLRVESATPEKAKSLAAKMMGLLAEGEEKCKHLTVQDEVECDGTKGEGTWHLTDKPSKVKYTLEHKKKGWTLARKFQFRAASGDIKIPGVADFNAGIMLEGRLQILGWEARARAEVGSAGVYLRGSLDVLDIKLLGFSLLSLSGSKTKVEDKKTILVADRDKGAELSLATFTAPQGREVPKGVKLNEKFLEQVGGSEKDFFKGAHAYVNACLSVFEGLGTVAVDCQISPKGMSLMGRGTLLKLLECNVDIMLFEGSGFSFAAELKMTIPEIDVGLVTIKKIEVGGQLKIQIGGPGVALAASLGVSFGYGTEMVLLGAIKFTLTQEVLDDFVGMLKNAVIDGLAAKLGLSEATELEKKWRWTRVEIINDTPFSLVWDGDKKDPAKSDISEYGNLINGAHGKYWQAPTDISPWAGGVFSACERASAITGCGGVTKFKMKLEEKATTEQFNVGWSNPLCHSVKAVAKKAYADYVSDVNTGWSSIYSYVGKVTNIQALKDAGDTIKGYIPEKIIHNPKCRGSFVEAQTVWDELDDPYLKPSHETKLISWANFEAEILTTPGDCSQVVIRQKGVAAAGRVSAAGSWERGEMAIVSPGGMLYCRTRQAGNKGVWQHCAPPRVLGRGFRNAEVLTLQRGDKKVFVLLAIATDERLYFSEKAASQGQGWQPLKRVPHLPPLGVAVSVSLPLQRTLSETVPFFVTFAEERLKFRTSVTLSPEGTLVFENGGGAPEIEHSRDLSRLLRAGAFIRVGISQEGTLVVGESPSPWKNLAAVADDKHDATAPEKLRSALKLYLHPGIHYTKPEDDAKPQWEKARDSVKDPKLPAKSVTLLSQMKALYLGRHDVVALCLDDLILCQDLILHELQITRGSQHPPPLREMKPKKIQQHAAVVQGQVLCIVVVDDMGELWQIRQVANPEMRAAFNQKSWDAIASEMKIDDDSYEWKAWEQLPPPPMVPLGNLTPDTDPSTDEALTQCRPERRFYSFCAGMSRDSHLHLFATDQDRALWHTSSPDAGLTWDIWRESTEAVLRQVEKVSCACENGEMEVFAITPGKELYHSHFTGPSSTQWSAWQNISAKEPAKPDKKN